MTEYWALTLKYNKNDLTSTELEVFYEQYKQKLLHIKDVEIVSWVKEDQDRKGRPTKLHIHGTLSIKRGVYRKKLLEPGFHIKLKAITDISTWNRYTKKNLVVKLFDNVNLHDDLSPAIPTVERNLFLNNI